MYRAITVTVLSLSAFLFANAVSAHAATKVLTGSGTLYATGFGTVSFEGTGQVSCHGKGIVHIPANTPFYYRGQWLRSSSDKALNAAGAGWIVVRLHGTTLRMIGTSTFMNAVGKGRAVLIGEGSVRSTGFFN